MTAALLALLFTGTVQAAISPPWNLVALHPVAWVPAFCVFARLEGRRALLAGWLVGIAAELSIFCWLPGTIVRYGNLPAPVAVAVWLLFAAATGFYTAVFAWGFGRIRRTARRAWPAAIAAWFCALEFLNPQIFGYLQGVAWYQHPSLFLLVAATGVSGVSFLVMLANAVAFEVWELRRSADAGAKRAAAANAALLAVCLAAAFVYSSERSARIDAAERAASPLRLAVVQPDHSVERREELSAQGGDAFARDLVEISREALRRSRTAGGEASEAAKPIDAFVWPEGALRSDPRSSRGRAAMEFARETGAEIWTGANAYDKVGNRSIAHNSAFRIFPDATVDVRYDKNILVPFGEYVPLRDVVPGFDRIETVGDFAPGDGVPTYRRGDARFVFLICYEAIRSPFVRAAAADGVNLLVNLTVDAWYGDLSEQSQHLMLAAIESAELGMPLVRSTTTGISAVVDARGLLTATTGTFTRDVILADVRPVRVPGLYAIAGEWFAWACVAASAALLAVATRAGRRAVSRSADGAPSAT